MIELITDELGVAPAITPDESQTSERRADEALPEGTVLEVTPEEEIVPYSDDDFEEVVKNKGEIDRRRLTPAQLAMQQTFDKYYTPKFQEAARIKKEAEEMIAKAKPSPPEPYFEEAQKNKVFTDYLVNPLQFTNNINSEITRLENVTPFDDDGNPNTKNYRDARSAIAYWNGVKDEFSMKRQEVIETKRENEIIRQEFGDDADKIESYAKVLGFSLQDLRIRPELRKTVKSLYNLASADKKADIKEIKPTAPKLSTPGGVSGVKPRSPDLMSTSEFIRRRNEELAKRR